MHIQHKSAVILSGFIWFGVGLFLTIMGISLLRTMPEQGMPVQAFLSNYFTQPEYPFLILVLVALTIGHLKGRFVLAKSANRGVNHIRSLPNPAPFQHIYSKGYLLLIAGMMGLGMSIKWLGIPSDVRGFIDLAVGAALLKGSMTYFQKAILCK